MQPLSPLLNLPLDPEGRYHMEETIQKPACVSIKPYLHKGATGSSVLTLGLEKQQNTFDGKQVI